jgi:ATP-dependent DNA ligase
VKALKQLPNNTVVDGEIVAFDHEARPSFNALQNYGSAPAPVVFYVFDVVVLSGKDLRREPLQQRRELLEKKVLPRLPEPVRYSAPLDAELPVLIQSLRRTDSRVSLRSDATARTCLAFDHARG